MTLTRARMLGAHLVRAEVHHGVAAAALVGSPRADRREAAVRSSLHKRVQAALGEYRPHRGSQASPLRDTLERRIEASI